MIAIAQKIAASPTGSIEEIALRISQEAPTLASLTPAQINQIAQLVLAQRLAGELSIAADRAEINYTAERTVFVNHAGKTGSRYTSAGYTAAIKKLDTWAASQSINPLALTPAQADDFIYTLKLSGAAPATIRRDIAAVSSFYTFLERRHNVVKNPFRGTRAKPENTPTRETIIPTEDEVKIIIAAMPPIETAILSTLVYRGLRAGALPPMVVIKAISDNGDKLFKSQSKGKTIEGYLPKVVFTTIQAAVMDTVKPFARFTVNAIEKRVNYQIGKLYKAGRIKAAYSCHDFRHFYAVQEYRKTKDIHRLSKLLHHSGIAVTEVYLKTLGETV
jgi:site-specific recombinase XerD